MSVAKVIELMAQGPTIEDAVQSAVDEAGATVRNIKDVWIKDIEAVVEDGEVSTYRVNTKITFLVDQGGAP